ncbi:MAG TPA: protein kinase [Streptomyces sp.]|nr:protein kinase [Streptomyces sp.]
MSSGEYGKADGTGRLLAGRYRVTARLGRGGMGVVWRAVDEVLGREVAVKELRTYHDADDSELADQRLRMRREARAAARVRHPGVVAVHDVAEIDGRPLIVMELVDGPSLDDVLRERGPLAPREAARIGAEVMDALVAAHRAGVLHRDVKPGNILLDRTGRVVLTDFGIAAMDEPGDGAATRLTRSGEIVGSLDYLAPERAEGVPPGPPSDVWALGATLFAAVEGTSPFRRTSAVSTLAAIVTDPLPELRSAGPLGPVLRQLMDKRVDSRPDAEQGRALLRAVAEGATEVSAAPPVRTETERSVTSPAPHPSEADGRVLGERPGGQPHAGPTSVSVPGASPRRRRGAVLLAAAAGVVVLGVTGAVAAHLHGQGEEKAAGKPVPGATATPAPERTRGELSPEPVRAGDGDGGDGKASPAPRATERPAGARTSWTRCHPNGRGTYDCWVWGTATSYTADGTEAGVLHSEKNYFYCQRKLGRQVTHGDYTNMWWAKTDDDSGNKGVYVSAVYIDGSGNNEPLRGLPYC